ncbi:MAG TPA: class I SAM-dependent methyltransferase [Caulobacteraceae bacterium]|jgi:SAM-dependent methyltransferase
MTGPSGDPTVYYDREKVHRNLEAGRHRQLIGGLWDVMGRKQYDYLLAQGLQPHHRLLDIGCGCFRGGVHFVQYLNPGNYYGIDISQELIDVGYEREIEPAGLAERLPKANLIAGADFDVSALGASYDYALAQSVFTHLPLEAFGVCLRALGPWMQPGGILFATFFEAPHPSRAVNEWVQEPGHFITHPDRDPFHSSPREILEAVQGVGGWDPVWVGDWGHPRAQKMLKVVRL